MVDAAFELYKNISSYRRLTEMIEDGETEGLHLECKSPSSPRLNSGAKAVLAKTISGFSNTAGGIILWGVSTTKHEHSGLDVLSQLEPIGSANRFEQQLRVAIPALVTPALLDYATKIIRQRPGESRGIVVTYIPKYIGDPVQSVIDNRFYFRSGDEFVVAPYEMIKRLFSATVCPDIRPALRKTMITKESDGTWSIPISLENRSSAVAEHVNTNISVINPSACESVAAVGLQDTSNINPGMTIFAVDVRTVVHRGLRLRLGTLKIKMKGGSRPKRRLDLAIEVYADRMRARQTSYSLTLAQSGASIKKTGEKFLY